MASSTDAEGDAVERQSSSEGLTPARAHTTPPVVAGSKRKTKRLRKDEQLQLEAAFGGTLHRDPAELESSFAAVAASMELPEHRLKSWWSRRRAQQRALQRTPPYDGERETHFAPVKRPKLCEDGHERGDSEEQREAEEMPTDADSLTAMVLSLRARLAQE